MSRSRYDLIYGELSMSPLNTEVTASTTGSGLYVRITQANSMGNDHVLLFPEQIQPMIDFLIEQRKAARKADHSRDNAKSKLMEVHGFDSLTANGIIVEAENRGVFPFVSEKVFEDVAETRRMRYVLECEWNGELQMDEYIIKVETSC